MEEGRKLLADHGDVLIEEVEPYIKASIAADDERARELAAAEQLEWPANWPRRRLGSCRLQEGRHCSSVRADRSARHRGVRFLQREAAGGRPANATRPRRVRVNPRLLALVFRQSCRRIERPRGRDSRHAPGAPGAASRRE